MRKDKVVVMAVVALLVVLGEGGGQPRREGHGSDRPPRLRRPKLATGEVATNADQPRLPVDVLPADGNDLAASHASHRSCEKDKPVDPAQGSRWRGLADRVEFREGEVPEIMVGISA